MREEKRLPKLPGPVILDCLPVAVARLQLESARTVEASCDRRGHAFPGEALAQLRTRCEARLGTAYERHRFGIGPKSNIFSLTAAQTKELESTAKRVVTDTFKENKRIFDRKPFDSSAFKAKGGQLAKALKAAADTISSTDEAILHLRFSVDEEVLSRWQWGPRYGDSRGMDRVFDTISGYLFSAQYDAWRMLLLISALIGDNEAHSAAVRQAACEFLGAGEKDGDFITTAIMQYLNVGYRFPGITCVDEENAFRQEINEAVERFK